MNNQLPYHCPELHGDFFKLPCDRQIAEAKERRAKSPTAYLGILEKCLECGGKHLMQREGAMSVVKPCDTLPENRQAMIQNGQIPSSNGVESLPEKTGNYDKNYDKAVEVIQKGDLAGIVQEKADKNAILRQSILGAIDIFEVKGVSPTRMMLSEHLGIKPHKIDLLIKELRTLGEVEIVLDSYPNEFKKPMIISSTANDVAKISTGPDLQKDAQNIHGIIHEAPTPTRLVNISGGQVAEIKDPVPELSTCEISQTDSSDACENARSPLDPKVAAHKKVHQEDPHPTMPKNSPTETQGYPTCPKDPGQLFGPDRVAVINEFF